MPWIVDGSNVGGVLAGAAGSRDRATVWRRVFAWAAGRRRVVLVFDGSADPAVPDHLGTVEVRWAAGITADEVVRRTVSRRPKEWRVVTDDRALKAVCSDLGAKVVGVRQWLATSDRAQPRDSGPTSEKSEEPVDTADWLEWFNRGD